MERIRSLIVFFENYLDVDEIPLFRGAIIDSVGCSNTELFHNHEDNGYRYSYPLIQYKRLNQKATIVCIGNGTEEIGKLFSSGSYDVRIGNKTEHLIVKSIRAEHFLIQCWDESFRYSIRKWLPFNKENYEQYTKLESLAEKYAMLERLLIGNILSFGKGVGIQFDKQVECKITAVSEPMSIMHKGVRLMGFDVEFKSNVSLPDYIGLGKGVSVGKGMVKRMESNKE